MKSSIAVGSILGLFSTISLLGQHRNDEWTVTLKQRHIESAGAFQGTVAMEGNQVSFAPIPEGGSEFNLWAYRQTPEGLEEHLVDTETVGAYLPEGNIWITTPDPYSGGTPRTRIDKGFTVNFQIDGLRSDAEAPEAARRVLLDHNIATTTGDPQAFVMGPEEDFVQSFIERNGPGGLAFVPSNIPGNDEFMDSGLEIFKLFALPDGLAAELELSSAAVQVWPKSRATFSGIDSNESYNIAPTVTIQLSNLYPASQTWVQFYPGPYVAGTTGTRLAIPPEVNTLDKPVNRQMILTTLDSNLLTTGEWTIEVLSLSAFGVDTLGNAAINMDRNLDLRGSFQALND